VPQPPAKTFAAPPFAAGESFELEKTRKFLAEGGSANSAPPEETSQATHLHQAATYGWFHVAELLLEHGAEINAFNKDHRTPLATTIDHGHVELAQLLIERGADIHLADVHGNTPLIYAVRDSLTPIVKMLLERGADPNRPAKGGLGCPIDIAGWAGNPAVIDLLVAHGARVNIYALHAALRSGCLEAAKALVRHGANLDVFSAAGLGDTAFLRTCLEGDKEWARKMANSGVMVGLSSSQAPLDFAAINNQVRAAEMLLDAGADPNRTSGWQHSALYVAVENDCRDMAVLLLQRGAKADVSSGARGVELPLHVAAAANRPEMIELLLAHGAKVDCTDSNGWTPLFKAAENGCLDAVKVLVSHGADVRARASNGFTVLHEVGRGSDVQGNDAYDVARFLLEKGADVNARTNDGWTPLDNAVDDRINELMQQHGGKKGKDLSPTPTKAGPAAKVNAGKSD
jgi:ankyrin repeat protein